MTLDDFLTLTLPKRIRWLRSSDGPQGAMSHDTLADILGTKRQVLIGWEKSGTEPNSASRSKLAQFSGFPPEAFSRRLAEPLVEEMLGRRLRGLAEADELLLAGQLRLLDHFGIEAPSLDGDDVRSRPA